MDPKVANYRITGARILPLENETDILEGSDLWIVQVHALAFSHLDAVLSKVGLDYGRIVTIEIALANFARDFSRMHRLYQMMFGKNSPARS